MSMHLDSKNDELRRFMDLSEGAASQILHSLGSLTPAFLGIGADGPFTLLETFDQRDAFADIIRLECVARRARMGVFIAEAWLTVTVLEPGQSPQAVRPSEDPSHRECVILRGEAAGVAGIVRILPILRDPRGEFSGLGKPEVYSGEDTGGRYSDLLPRRRPSDYERVAALNALAAKRSGCRAAAYGNN
jgi:hypothetical protein